MNHILEVFIGTIHYRLVPLVPVALLLLMVPQVPLVLYLLHFYHLIFSTKGENCFGLAWEILKQLAI